MATAATKTAAKKPTKTTAKKAAPKTTAKAKSTPKPKTRRTPARATGRTAKAHKVLTPEQREKQRERVKARLAKQHAAAQRAELRALPKPPKRSLNAYALYIKEQPKLENENAKEMIQRLSKTWHQLPLSEKARLEEQAQVLKQVRKLDYERWANFVGRDAILKLNKARTARGRTKLAMPVPKTKRPTSSFLSFFHDQFNNEDLKGETASERAKVVGQRWKTLPAAEKARYVDQAKKDLEAFKAAHGSS